MVNKKTYQEASEGISCSLCIVIAAFLEDRKPVLIHPLTPPSNGSGPRVATAAVGLERCRARRARQSSIHYARRTLLQQI